MKRSCRFGLRLGVNLVIAVVALVVLFMALEVAADSQEYEAEIVRPQSGAILSGATYYPIIRSKAVHTSETPRRQDPHLTQQRHPRHHQHRRRNDPHSSSHRQTNLDADPVVYADTDSQAFAVTLANSAAIGNAHTDSPDIHTDTYQRQQRSDLQQLSHQHDQRRLRGHGRSNKA